MAGVIDQAPIARVWTAPRAPDPQSWDDFYRVLCDHCLIHGAFLSNAGIDLVVAVATYRLTALDSVDLPLTPTYAHA